MTSAEIERRLRDQAYDSAEGAAAAASDAEEALGDVIAEARDFARRSRAAWSRQTTRDARWLSCDSATGRSPIRSGPSRSCTRAR
jgi:hypothetical protein